MFWRVVAYFKPVGVPLIEGYLRWRDRIKLLQLKLTGRSTIVEIANEGSLSGTKVAIFATYPTESVASYHSRFLEGLEKAGYDIIIASHHPRARTLLADFVARGWCVMFRRPFGRDFGCYRDASRLLYARDEQRDEQIERILYINDSVVTMVSGEDEIIGFLDSPDHHFVGITDNFDRSYHVSSYMMGISGEVFRSPPVRRFWAKYRALSTRRHAISRGELGFSRCVARAGYMAHIQWPISKLKTRLEDLSVDDVSRIAESMETDFRLNRKHPLIQINEYIDEFLQSRKSQIFSVRSKLIQSIVSRITEEKSKRKEISAEGDSEIIGMTNQEQLHIFNRASRDRSIDAILNYIARGSHIHHGAALLLFIGAGVLKKDVVLRRIVEPYNIEKLLRDTQACSLAEIDEIAVEIISKGYYKSFRGRRELLLRWDFI